jgi:hypothetical protein
VDVDGGGAALEWYSAETHVGDPAGQQEEANNRGKWDSRLPKTEGATPAQVDLAAELHAEDEAAAVHWDAAVALDSRLGRSGDESLPGEGGIGHVGHGIECHVPERGSQLPSVGADRRLGRVRDGQRLSGRDTAGHAQKGCADAAGAKKKCAHYTP